MRLFTQLFIDVNAAMVESTAFKIQQTESASGAGEWSGLS